MRFLALLLRRAKAGSGGSVDVVFDHPLVCRSQQRLDFGLVSWFCCEWLDGVQHQRRWFGLPRLLSARNHNKFEVWHVSRPWL